MSGNVHRLPSRLSPYNQTTASQPNTNSLDRRLFKKASKETPQQSVTTIPNKGVQFTPVAKRLTTPISSPFVRKTLSQLEISQTKTKVLNASQTESDVPIAPPRLPRKTSPLIAPITNTIDTPLDSSPIPPAVSPPPRPLPPKVSSRPPPPRVSPYSTKTNDSRQTSSSHETSQFPRQHKENKKPSLDSSLSVSLSSLNFQDNPCQTQRLSDTTLANKPITPPTRPPTRSAPPVPLINPLSRPLPPRNIPDPNFKKHRTTPILDLPPRPQTTEPPLLPTETFSSHTMTKRQSPRPPPVIRDLTKTAPIPRPKSIHHVTSEENKKDVYTIPGQVVITNNPEMIPWYASSDNTVLKFVNLEQLVQNEDPSLLSKDNNSELQTASLSTPDDDDSYYNLITDDQSGYVLLTLALKEDSVHTPPTSSPAAYMPILEGNKEEDTEYTDLNTSDKPVKPIKPIKPAKPVKPVKKN